MIEEQGMFSEGNELQPTPGEGTWLRPNTSKTKVFSVHDHDEEEHAAAHKETENDNTVDASYDDIDTLQPEEKYYKFSRGPNTPISYGKMIPFLKKKTGQGYHVYLGPDCNIIMTCRAIFFLLAPTRDR